jgi:two-component system nitrate/nitrite response regulator NarL
MQIFSLIIKNKSSQEIANTLFISKDTVSTHRKNIIRKTGCNTTIEMLRLAIELGIDYEIKLN